jgi:hypothetical protein
MPGYPLDQTCAMAAVPAIPAIPVPRHLTSQLLDGLTRLQSEWAEPSV